MSNVKVAAIQMSCDDNQQNNLEKARNFVIEAAKQQAKIVLLPELFDRVYFCQEKRYDYYHYAMELNEHPSVKMGVELAKQYDVVLSISFYERDGNVLYNSVACIDATGEILGVYRKTHIPDDHFYQEKFYFTPGDTGFQVFSTRYGKVGIGICWDQWFPETARSLAILGAEMILYPTAIGSEPILNSDSMPHWRRCMQGHAAANLMPVIAANRIGSEKVLPCEENAGLSSELCFYGSSFLTDETGELVQSAGREEETVLVWQYDLDTIGENRLSWGVFRDRRPDMYRLISNS